MSGGTIKATLRRKGGGVIELNLPRSLEQVPLNRFIDFLVECRKFGDDGENQFVLMAQAISGFCDFPFAEMLEAEVGDISSPDIQGLDGAIRGIFGYITSMVKGAEGTILDPNNAVFEFKGERWRIPVIMQQALAGEWQLPKMAVIDTIEASEIQRFRVQKTQMAGDPEGKIKARIMAVANAEVAGLEDGDPTKLAILQAAEKVVNIEVEALGDPSGSLLYSMYLKMLAVICRRDGMDEQMPFDDAEREQWINDRAMYFRGINAQTALNVDFFLTSILPIYENGRLVAGFLSRQSFAVVAETLLKKTRRTIVGKSRTRKRFAA